MPEVPGIPNPLSATFFPGIGWIALGIGRVSLRDGGKRIVSVLRRLNLVGAISIDHFPAAVRLADDLLDVRISNIGKFFLLFLFHFYHHLGHSLPEGGKNMTKKERKVLRLLETFEDKSREKD